MKTFLLPFFLLVVHIAQAQNSKPPLIYKKAISISPLALADLDHTFMLTGEYRLNNKLALVTDVGYIFASDYIGDVKKTWGFNLRPSLRMYHGKRNKGYLQAQAFYKTATYRLYDWVGKDCVNDVPAYEQQMDFDYKKQVVGFNIIAGSLLVLSKSQQWLIDLYGGLGFRYKTHRMADETMCYNLNGGALLDLYGDEVTTLSVPMGFRLTYVLK